MELPILQLDSIFKIRSLGNEFTTTTESFTYATKRWIPLIPKQTDRRSRQPQPPHHQDDSTTQSVIITSLISTTDDETTPEPTPEDATTLEGDTTPKDEVLRESDTEHSDTEESDVDYYPAVSLMPGVDDSSDTEYDDWLPQNVNKRYFFS